MSMSADQGPSGHRTAYGPDKPLPMATQPASAPPDKPYEKLIQQLVPGWTYPQKLGTQDSGFFSSYRNSIDALASSERQTNNYSPALLAASQRIYDAEAARRESINTRCGAVLSTGGILGALFVATGQLGLGQLQGSSSWTAWFLLAVFIIALVYLGASIAMALAVHGSEQGNVVDPSDLDPGVKQPNINDYEVRLAKKNLAYTVMNYELNNRLKFQLHSAQRCLRNAIIAIIVAGIISPFVLH